MDPEDGQQSTEFGDDRVFNDLRYTINSDKLHALGWKEVGEHRKEGDARRERGRIH